MYPMFDIARIGRRSSLLDKLDFAHFGLSFFFLLLVPCLLRLEITFFVHTAIYETHEMSE